MPTPETKEQFTLAFLGAGFVIRSPWNEMASTKGQSGE